MRNLWLYASAFDPFCVANTKPDYMKPLFALTLLLACSFGAFSQTPIDNLQKQNLQYLELQESEGYEFRSQIITEFDESNASQNVNIKLSEEFTYIIVAIGDSNIPTIDLDIKPANGAKMEALKINSDLAGQSFRLAPSKSGGFKISINATGLSATQKGFISFMVLRK